MELREYNYQTTQFLAKLRRLLRRDGNFLRVAFQRSVILTRKGEPYRHAITRLDFFQDEHNLPKESQRNYAQIRFIAERLTIGRALTRLGRLRHLRFTAAKSSVKLAHPLNFQNDYRPRNNEYSDWPGTLFDATLDSSIYLSGDTLLDPLHPTYVSEYQAVSDFLDLANFSFRDGRTGHLQIFVPNYNGRIERLHLSGNTLRIELLLRGSLDELILDIEYSTEKHTKKLSRQLESPIQSVELEFRPTNLNIWLKSRRGYVLDYHTQTPHWSVGVEGVLPNSEQTSTNGTDSSLEESTSVATLLDTGEVQLSEVVGALVTPGSQRERLQHSNRPDENPRTERPPRVFLSYSWDTPRHKQWVLELATRLQGEGGVEIILDRWHLMPGKDKAVFMERGVADSDFVVVVCTPDYSDRAKRRHGGVGYEAMVITGELAQNIEQDKFIPILRSGDWKCSLPGWIKSKVGVDLCNDPYSEEAYAELLRALHREPLKPPPIGPKPDWPMSVAGGQQEQWDVTARLAKGMVIEGPNPLTVERRGEMVTICISSFGARFDGCPSPVYYNSGSISLLGVGVTYYVFAQDPERKGGAVTYQATVTLGQALAGRETLYIGSVRVPA